jgi:hypothetical protein
MVTTDYSSNNNYTGELEQFLAENTNQMINGERVFNQWTGKETDACEYKNLLNLATKPMEYYVNSLNNISGIHEDNNQNDNFLSFTPIGYAAHVNIPNFLDRAIPSHLNNISSVYTLPYLTSPNLQMANNINILDTDNDLILKTGLHLRPKNNKAHLSSKKLPHFGDIHATELNLTVQNAGQNADKSVSNKIQTDIPGLRNSYDYKSSQNGIGINALGGVLGFGVPTRVALSNLYNGPSMSCKQYMNK